jgi:hypothetical protein
MHSMNCIKGNSKSDMKLWGAIDESYNNTTDVHHQRTAKNLKDY